MSAFDAEREVGRWLDSIRSAVDERLRELIAAPLPDGAALLEFELHHDSNWTDFPIVCYPMDRSAGQCGYFDFEGVPGLSRGVVEQARSDDAGLAFAEAVGRGLFKWFPEQWRSAGGVASGIPAYLSNHDDIESLDLNTGKMIDSEEKWTE